MLAILRPLSFRPPPPCLKFPLCHLLAVGLQTNPFTSSNLSFLTYKTVPTSQGCCEE